MHVVNILGVPGAGKSTCSAYIFSQLKMAGLNVELVTEYAKDKVWEENKTVFSKSENQAYIFGKQYYRMSRCQDKVDVIITDSPLILSVLCNRSPILGENFNNMVLDVFNSYNNINYFLNRVQKYNPIGRIQTEEESNALVSPLKGLLDDNNISYIEMDGCQENYDIMVEQILEKIKE